MNDFERWWKNIGSGMVIAPGMDVEEHTEIVARIAYERGMSDVRRQAREEERDTFAEGVWSERQGEEYGSY